MGAVDWLEASYQRKEANIMDAANKVIDSLFFELEGVLAGWWAGREFGSE
jgi:hypothetical protein